MVAVSPEEYKFSRFSERVAVCNLITCVCLVDFTSSPIGSGLELHLREQTTFQLQHQNNSIEELLWLFLGILEEQFLNFNSQSINKLINSLPIVLTFDAKDINPPTWPLTTRHFVSSTSHWRSWRKSWTSRSLQER